MTMTGTSPVGTYAETASTGAGGTTPTVWFAQADANSAVLQRPGDCFAPHPAATPGMSVVVDAGFVTASLPTGQQTVTEAAQQTVTITTAPGAPNSRIDLVVVDAGTGVASVIAGAPATPPAAPALPAGKLKVALVAVASGVTAIGSTGITDVRAVWSGGVPGVPWCVGGGTANAITAAYTPANATLADGLLLAVRVPGVNTSAAPTFAPDGLTARTITKMGGEALAAGDLPGNLAECLLRFNVAYSRWELLNPPAQIYVLTAAEIDTALGFTPVQQGTGVGQNTGNVVKIGWSGSKIKATIDVTDEGNIALESWVTSQINTLQGGINTLQGEIITLNGQVAAIQGSLASTGGGDNGSGGSGSGGG